jgi:hypothetical protein
MGPSYGSLSSAELRSLQFAQVPLYAFRRSTHSISTSYQALLVAHTLKAVVVSAEASSLKRCFVAINVVSFVWSTIVAVIMLVFDK